MIAAFFWPFLIRSWVSIVFMSEVGPLPSKAGRTIGRLLAEGDGTSTVSDDVTSAINNKVSSKDPGRRMANYASGTGGLCKGKVAPARPRLATHGRPQFCARSYAAGSTRSMHRAFAPGA